MPISEEFLEQKLKAALEPVFVRVEDFSDGCGFKFNVLVASSKFEGQSLLQRQRLVNETLKEEMQQIHALTQKCVTPDQFAAMLKENPNLADKRGHSKSACSSDPNTKCIH